MRGEEPKVACLPNGVEAVVENEEADVDVVDVCVEVDGDDDWSDDDGGAIVVAVRLGFKKLAREEVAEGLGEAGDFAGTGDLLNALVEGDFEGVDDAETPPGPW